MEDEVYNIDNTIGSWRVYDESLVTNISYYDTSNASVKVKDSGSNWISYGCEANEINDLKKEVKELRKMISRLSTLVCTHIGEEQKASVNNG